MGRSPGTLPTGVDHRPGADHRPRRYWTAVGLAFCAIAGAGATGTAQTIWDDPAFLLYREAMEALDRKDYERATDLATQAIARYANHPLAYYLRGQAAAARARWQDAVTSFAKVAELYPDSFAAQRELGTSLEHLGRTEEAARAWEAALALHDDERVRANLAFMLVRAGQQPRALAQLQILADRDTTLPEVWTLLGRVKYEAGDFAASEKAYIHAVGLRDEGRSWFNLGVVRVRLSDLPGALEAFERAAQHVDVRTQAETEANRIRETMRR